MKTCSGCDQEKEAIKYFAWFEGRTYPKIKVKLREGGIVTNVGKFIESHLPIAKANYSKKTYLPYVHRLDEVKKAIEKHESSVKKNIKE